MGARKSNFRPAKQHATLTSGEVIRLLHELKGGTQEELAKNCSINAKNISLLENNKVEIGEKRAEQLAMAYE
jgi:transcriptional regulator with XRE-family HTH domain